MYGLPVTGVSGVFYLTVGLAGCAVAGAGRLVKRFLDYAGRRRV